MRSFYLNLNPYGLRWSPATDGDEKPRDKAERPPKRASDVAMDEYDKIKDQVEYAVKPFIKVKVYKPEGIEEEEFRALEADEEFEKEVERLALKYIRSRRK